MRRLLRQTRPQSNLLRGYLAVCAPATRAVQHRWCVYWNRRFLAGLLVILQTRVLIADTASPPPPPDFVIKLAM